jgi:hypothetical protein
VIDEEGGDLEPVAVVDRHRLFRSGPWHIMTDHARGFGRHEIVALRDAELCV